MASLLKTAHLFPKDTDFLSCVPTSASKLRVQSIQAGKGKRMGAGEFFPFELVTQESGRHQLRFWLDEVTYNCKIFAPHGSTSFMVKEEDVINDLLTVEKEVQSMNLFPNCTFNSLLKKTQSTFRGKSYEFTSVRTKVTDKTGIFENGEKGTLEALQQCGKRKASAILLLTGVFRNDETKSYKICSRLEQIMWKHVKPVEQYSAEAWKASLCDKEAIKQKEETSIKESEEPVVKCRKEEDKRTELDRLKDSFMKDYFVRQMDNLLLVATDIPSDDSCDFIFLSSLIETVLNIEAQIQSSEDLSMVLSHLTDTYNSMVRSYNQTYMAQPYDNLTWSQMRTDGLAIQVYDIYTLILSSMIVLDNIRHATPIPSTQEAFQKYCDKHYRRYHIWISQLSMEDELKDWVSTLKHFLALPVIRSILDFFPHFGFQDSLQVSDENLTLMKNLKEHPFYPIMNDFINMVEEKLITNRRFNQALMEINRYLKSISEGIQFTTSERFLKECFNWSFDKWMDSYMKANVPFSQRHGLLDERCRPYLLHIMKMVEKRGREHFGENKWTHMTTIRRKRLAKVCEEGRREFDNTMVDVDTCAYTVMKEAQVSMNKLQC